MFEGPATLLVAGEKASVSALACAGPGCRPKPTASSSAAIQFRLQPLRTLKKASNNSGQHSQ